jgi:predicted GNAT family acetyltransferase
MERMDVRNNIERSRYELVRDDRVIGVADYYLRDGVMVFPHTAIEPELRGRGLGAVLVKRALDDVRRKGGRIVPACWFVADFVQANPEYADMLG